MDKSDENCVDYKERLEALDPNCLIHEYGVPGAVVVLVRKIRELETAHNEVKTCPDSSLSTKEPSSE